MVRHFNKIISEQIYMKRNEDWNAELSILDKNAKPFWNIVKLVRNKNRKIPFLKDSSSTLSTDLEKANLIGENFSRNHLVSQHLGESETNQLVNEAINRFDALYERTPHNIFITEENIKALLKSLKTQKSDGIDKIKNTYLKNLPNVGIRYLTFLINACLKSQYFPQNWKKAMVVPVLKAGKTPDNAKSYRPISLLSNISKVFEKILKEQILKIVSEKRIFPDIQFGFRRHHNTSHQVKRICNHVLEHRLRGESTGMVLIDIEKAFDSVWHNGIIYKMMKFEFPLYLCKIVQSFLSHRCFQVHVNCGISKLFCFGAGVPQGSVLGPALYNLFTSDFPSLPNCEAAIFADDTAVFASHEFALNIETNLKNAITILEQYYNKWKIKLNVGKMQAIFFTRKRKACFLPNNQLQINGVTIEWSQSVKYLGVHLDTKLTFSQHIQNTLRKMSIAIRMLYPFINRKSSLTNENKIVIHKVICNTIVWMSNMG